MYMYVSLFKLKNTYLLQIVDSENDNTATYCWITLWSTSIINILEITFVNSRCLGETKLNSVIILGAILIDSGGESYKWKTER